jgi:hypothetical protein
LGCFAKQEEEEEEEEEEEGKSSSYFNTRWFKYDRDYLCVNKSQFVPVIFEPPCIYICFRENNIIVI